LCLQEKVLKSEGERPAMSMERQTSLDESSGPPSQQNTPENTLHGDALAKLSQHGSFEQNHDNSYDAALNFVNFC
jgi:hypothetical protein